jgi:ABC-type bacteriocin/lantibiotic exporter with double-glycine peptidase domain
MAHYLLDVPVEAQTSSDTCWHTAALMIWYYWQGISGRQGPMNTLAEPWVRNQPINTWAALGQQTGLKGVDRSATYTSDSLEKMLKDNGPIWCAGNWYGPGHIVVLTGIDGDSIRINDPDGGRRKVELVSWFNTHLYNPWPNCLMCKDPGAY